MVTASPVKNLHIAMVLDTFGDVRNGGVISTQRFTKLLREDGNRVLIISSANETEPDKLTLKSFYPPFVAGIMRQMNFIFAWPEAHKIREALKGVDLVHIQMPFLLGMITARIARSLGKPMVASFHVQAEQLLHNVGLKSPWIVRLTYWLFIKLLYNKADLVVCPSSFAAAEIRRYGLQKPTVVISNGVTPNYHPMDFPKQYPGKFVVLNVGRNAAEKKQEVLLRAVAMSRYKEKIKVVMIGNGPLRQHLMQLDQDLLDGSANFEYLPPEEVIRWYNTADLYVHCAAIEVECMTALESMACGLPLLIANEPLSAASQFALSEQYIFSTVEELSQKIDFWIEHPALLQQASAAYLDLAKEYCIETSLQKLKAAYQAVLR